MSKARRAEADRILRELIVISRRGIADARRASVSLSMTDQSILGYIVDHPGARGVDIAEAYRLNRSTVSRQLAGLVRLGIVREAERSGRGRPLELTDAGRAAYDEALGILQAEVDGQLDGQLDGWSDAEVARFAADLHRFNGAAAPASSPPPASPPASAPPA